MRFEQVQSKHFFILNEIQDYFSQGCSKICNFIPENTQLYLIIFRYLINENRYLMNKNRIKTVILCDGRQPESIALHHAINDSKYFIAADGGGNVARRMGELPDIVIGDMDSFEPSEKEDIQIIHDEDQETNDLEKSLNHALKLLSTDVTVFGAVGKRLDHTLKNLSVLCRFTASFNSLIYKDRHGDIFMLPKKFRQTYPVGTTLSLFPISGIAEGVSTNGLKYPLMNESLENGVRDGTSNRSVSPVIEITYQSGDLLLFVSSESEKKNS